MPPVVESPLQELLVIGAQAGREDGEKLRTLVGREFRPLLGEQRPRGGRIGAAHRDEVARALSAGALMPGRGVAGPGLVRGRGQVCPLRILRREPGGPGSSGRDNERTQLRSASGQMEQIGKEFGRHAPLSSGRDRQPLSDQRAARLVDNERANIDEFAEPGRGERTDNRRGLRRRRRG